MPLQNNNEYDYDDENEIEQKDNAYCALKESVQKLCAKLAIFQVI